METPSGKRLLLVDDDHKILRTMHRLLYSTWEVEIASGVNEARAMLAERHYDVVLSDWDMPDGGGWAILEASSAPVVIHSGSDAKLINKICAGRNAGFVAKPAFVSDIDTALKVAIKSRQV